MIHQSRHCKNCNKDISNKPSHRIFCSRSCSISHQQKLKWAKLREEKSKLPKIEKIKEGYKVKQCIVCNKDFKPTSATQRFCSEECKYREVRLNCEICGKEFYTWSKTKHKTCSFECRNKSISKNKEKAERITLKCKVCNKEFVKRTSQVKSVNIFCSRICKQLWMKLERPQIIAKQKETIKKQLENGRKIFNQNFKKGYFFSKKNNMRFIFRSSWEESLMKKFEEDKNVLSYKSEPFSLEYEVGNKRYKYWPDIIVNYIDKIELIEVKPKQFLKNNINKLKFAAAEQYCKDHNMIFRIITEDDLFIS
jgi:hypothetical protein